MDNSVARENNHGATHKTNHKFDALTISDTGKLGYQQNLPIKSLKGIRGYFNFLL